MIANEAPPRACLVDFGVSTLVHGVHGTTTTVTSGGTPVFMAPELLRPASPDGPNSRPRRSTDIYALGMVIYEVLTGSYPFHERKWTVDELVSHVTTGLRPTKPADAEQIGFADETWELVQKCWNGELKRRPTIDHVLTHLTCVAAYSKAVDPTPEESRESTVDSSDEPSTLMNHDGSSLDGHGETRQTSPATTTVQHGGVSNVPTHYCN